MTKPNEVGHPTEHERRIIEGVTDPVSRVILDLDGSQCVACKGGKVVALESSETTVRTRCQGCGQEGSIEV